MLAVSATKMKQSDPLVGTPLYDRNDCWSAAQGVERNVFAFPDEEKDVSI